MTWSAPNSWLYQAGVAALWTGCPGTRWPFRREEHVARALQNMLLDFSVSAEVSDAGSASAEVSFHPTDVCRGCPHRKRQAGHLWRACLSACAACRLLC